MTTSEDQGPEIPGEAFGTEADQAKAKEARHATLNERAPLAGSFLRESLVLMQRRATGEAKPIPVPWPEVAERMGGGLWPGLHVLTGTTGTGKTQFALQVAWKAALANVPVLYIGLELGQLDVTARLLALAEGEATGRRPPKWSELYLGKRSQADLECFATEHGPTIEALPFRAEFGPPQGWSYTELGERVKAMREEYPERTPGELPMLVVLDYLQVVGSPGGERLDLRERIGRAAYAGRAVARDYGAAVLVVSSVSRENGQRMKVNANPVRGNEGSRTAPTTPGNEPGCTPASDFVGLGKESGEIEYAADTVSALVAGDFDKAGTQMWLAVAKVRAGRAGWC